MLSKAARIARFLAARGGPFARRAGSVTLRKMRPGLLGRRGEQLHLFKPSLANKFLQSKLGSRVARTYDKLEDTFRPKLHNTDKVGRLAFRTELGAAGLATAGSLYGVHSERQAKKRRDAALSRFETSLKKKSSRVRRLRDR